MPFDRGTVILALFPHSDLTTASRRPALVVQRDELGTGIPQLVVALTTTNPSGQDHPSRVFVAANSPEGKACGLMLDSVIRTDNLATIREEEIDRVLGAYPDMTSIDVALRHTLNL